MSDEKFNKENGNEEKFENLIDDIKENDLNFEESLEKDLEYEFEQEKKEKIDDDKILSKISNDKNDENDNARKFRLPENIYFGFEEGISKSHYEDIITTINKYVKDNFKSKRNSYFKIHKVKKHPYLPDGYFYEIHEGGEQIGFGQYILEHFEDENHKYIILPIKNEDVHVVRKHNNIETNYLTGFNDFGESNKFYIKEEWYSNKKNKMDHVFKDKYTFFVMGFIVFITSVLFFAFNVIYKYAILDVQQPTSDIQDYAVFPMNQIEYLNSTANSRVVSIEYKNGEWISKKEIKDENNETKIIEQKIYLNQKVKDLKNNQMKEIINSKAE